MHQVPPYLGIGEALEYAENCMFGRGQVIHRRDGPGPAAHSPVDVGKEPAVDMVALKTGRRTQKTMVEIPGVNNTTKATKEARAVKKPGRM